MFYLFLSERFTMVLLYSHLKLGFLFHLGILFKNQDPHVILSAGKDNYLYQHVFRDARKPANDLIPTGVALSVEGTVGHAFQVKRGENKRYNYSVKVFNVCSGTW